ncbi:hypothetical protein DIPPA_05579 [Diplonema papillatum]|nr:hypothetical protein DIPPA_05579 [Diplonema papillatum]
MPFSPFHNPPAFASTSSFAAFAAREASSNFCFASLAAWSRALAAAPFALFHAPSAFAPVSAACCLAAWYVASACLPPR